MDQFQIAMLMLVCVFYLSYFYKQISLRKKGIETNRLAKGKKDIKATKTETALLILTCSTALMQYISIIPPTIQLHTGIWVRYIGILLTGIGCLFFILAIIAMKENWRAGIDETQDTHLVTGGVYKISRNPAFVGFDLIYIGTALVFPNFFMIILAIVSIIVFHLQILEEEKFVESKFGSEYLSYKAKTSRYIFF